MAETTLPEEMIVSILSWLPVKSLIRFTCVSKRFHSLILSDPKFAQSQFRAARDRKTPTPRLLCSSCFKLRAPKFESLDLESPSFGDFSSVRELKLPFQPAANYVSLLGSCNGIVFLAFDYKIFYMWNPSIGFFKNLPHPGFSTNENDLHFYGVGYLPATDDYIVFVNSIDFFDDKNESAIYSSRSQAWKTLVVDFDVFSVLSNQGILLKEALHWVHDRDKILAFDLAQEEEKHKFRAMLPPRDFNDHGGDYYFNHLGVSPSTGGCLSLVRYRQSSADCIHVWVMREYDVRDSWTVYFEVFGPPRGVLVLHWRFGSGNWYGCLYKYMEARCQ
ncbi:PREDICTED: F-box/kelch-repeat protein At3g23880-like [Fragaria vesca subsp. vesca]|uniref:F-box/kelch-repeat protein At3g23880-like n=1 Tax=Fragaria vesca subsp. vesca TaxID=101020 RepID=UPI0002C333CD|nr:PREDICTED: F-box/kelch-repeat protein At3g23880-like [Fragaria vesca subsp. vesca]